MHNSKVWPCTNVKRRNKHLLLRAPARDRQEAHLGQVFSRSACRYVAAKQSAEFCCTEAISLYFERPRSPKMGWLAHVHVAKDDRQGCVWRGVPGASCRASDRNAEPFSSFGWLMSKWLRKEMESFHFTSALIKITSARFLSTNLMSDPGLFSDRLLKARPTSKCNRKKYFPSNLKDICLSSVATVAAAAAQAARPDSNFSCACAPPQILTFPICCFCTTANV